MNNETMNLNPENLPPIEEPIQPTLKINKKKPVFSLITLVLLFITLGIAGFFAYQKYSVKQQVSTLTTPPADQPAQEHFTAEWDVFLNITPP